MHKGKKHRKLLMTKKAIRRRRKYRLKQRLYKKGIKCLVAKGSRQKKITRYFK